MYFNVNFNVFFKLIKFHLLVSELYFITIFTASRTSEHISFKQSIPFRFTERTVTPVKGAQEVTDTRHTSDNKLAKNLLQPAAK